MIAGITVAALWATTAWRAPTLRRSHRKRALWAAFAACSIGLTAGLDPIARGIDTSSGVPGLATLIKHLAGLACCASVLDFVSDLTPTDQRTRRAARGYLGAGLAAIALILLFAFMPQGGADGTVDQAAGHLLPSLYQAVFFTYLATTMGIAARRFTQARHATRRSLRHGVTILAVGSGLGAIYAVSRVAFLLLRLVTGPHSDVDLAGTTIANGLLYSAVLLIITGSALPAAELSVRRWRHYQALHRLRPLWHDLTSAVPDILLEQPSRSRDLLDPRDLRIRLVRRAAEIRDAALLLGAWNPTDLAHARTLAAPLTPPGISVEAAAEAALLHAALHRKTLGRPTATSTDRPPTGGGTDLDTDLAWLQHLAHAYANPAIAELGRQLAETPG